MPPNCGVATKFLASLFVLDEIFIDEVTKWGGGERKWRYLVNAVKKPNNFVLFTESVQFS